MMPENEFDFLGVDMSSFFKEDPTAKIINHKEKFRGKRLLNVEDLINSLDHSEYVIPKEVTLSPITKAVEKPSHVHRYIILMCAILLFFICGYSTVLQLKNVRYSSENPPPYPLDFNAASPAMAQILTVNWVGQRTATNVYGCIIDYYINYDGTKLRATCNYDFIYNGGSTGGTSTAFFYFVYQNGAWEVALWQAPAQLYPF